MQEAALLSTLLQGIQEENRSEKPILVKIAPDLSTIALEEIIAVCSGNAVAGIIATNTTTDHATIPRERDQAGGLSGLPLQEKSSGAIRMISSQCSIPVIGCGGITDGASAREKIEAGAALVQIYTGLVYRGPGLLREISAAIADINPTDDD